MTLKTSNENNILPAFNFRNNDWWFLIFLLKKIYKIFYYKIQKILVITKKDWNYEIFNIKTDKNIDLKRKWICFSNNIDLKHKWICF